MNLTIFEGVQKYRENICPLRTLIDILQKISSGPPFSILEIARLNEFPETDVLLHNEQFSPRWIIEYMMKTHVNTMELISSNSTHFLRFVYEYKSSDEEKQYVFTNNMMFYVDVITICYLYFIRKIEGYENFVPAFRLLKIMRKKYNIYDSLNSVPTYNMPHTQAITWRRIAHSFPSITFTMLYHDIVDGLFSNALFPCVNLPKIYHLPLIASIIPVLHRNTPLALLLLIAIFLDRGDKSRHDSVTPLDRLFLYTSDLYTSEAFPTRLKLELCMKWGIVHVVENRYKFASYFEQVREEAKMVISNIWPNEPGLEYVLSNI